jgi:hypothetical protein
VPQADQQYVLRTELSVVTPATSLAQPFKEMLAVCRVGVGNGDFPVALGFRKFDSLQLREHHPGLIHPTELTEAGEQRAKLERQPPALQGALGVADCFLIVSLMIVRERHMAHKGVCLPIVRV